MTAGAGLTGGGATGAVTLDVGAGAGIAVGANAVSLADGGVTTAKLAAAAVATGKIADGAVTPAKVSTGGGSSGQVLKHTGSAVVWGDDNAGGLTLPYSGSASLPSQAAFQVVNSAPASFGTWAVKGDASGSGGGGGVHGVSMVASGVAGRSTAGDGVEGSSQSGFGVAGYSFGTAGVFGQGSENGVRGENTGTASWGYLGGEYGAYGVHGISGNFGMLGTADQGVYGENATTHAKGSFGSSDYGVYGRQYGGTHAGYFNGDVQVNGTLSKWGGSFRIDHPLDPENKYLSHSFVESPDMMNIYNGNVITDAEGYATVELPEWFEALNRDFRYQLTVIGQFAQAIVAQKIDGNRFVIRTNLGNVEVSWQVTGIRRDAWAEANRIQVEEDKPEAERGTYLAPDAWGQPKERGLEWLQEEAGIRSDREPAAARETPADPR